VQHLDGDAALDERIFALENGAHAPFTDQAHYPILVIEDLSGLKRHAEVRCADAPQRIRLRP
jgi:hypothetical protein